MSSQLQNKLLHYEVQPPDGVWDNIAASLNEEFPPSLSERLYKFEAIPDNELWDKINTELNRAPGEKAKVIPFYTKYRRPLKYSGAVAIFTFLAVLTSLLISKKTESELPAQNAVTQVKKDSSKSPLPTEEKSVRNEDDRKTVIPRTNARKSQEVTHNSRSTDSDESFLPRRAERNEIVSSSLAPDKYMIYSDEDGNAIRLPKKIFSAFACPTDDFICKQRLQQLREKFAASAMTADFNGLLQILKSLQENQ